MRYGWTRILNVGGAISVGLGSLFALIAYANGKHARQLQSAHQIENLTREFTNTLGFYMSRLIFRLNF